MNLRQTVSVMMFPLFSRKDLEQLVKSYRRLIGFCLLVMCVPCQTGTAATGIFCLTDDTGREVCVSEAPRRVISLAPNLTETVCYLGAQDKLVGRTARCNRPASAANIPQVGAYLHPDMERIIALKPDLVLAAKPGLREEIVERLSSLGIPVFVEDSKSVDDVCRLMGKLGRLFKREKTAAEAVEDIQRRRRALQERLEGLPSPSVLFAVGVKPLVVAGGRSFLGALIREAGGVNIAENIDIPYARFSFEEVIKIDPEYILILDKECKQQECVDHLRRYPTLRAVRDEKVVSVDADLVARPAPAVIEALELIAKTLHPHAQEMRALHR